MPSHEFAQKQMKKYGWSKGKGLGKSENGMTSAIKVKLKNNSDGLGLDQGAEFSFHWWDHIFNKAASSFTVNESDTGALIEKCEGKKVAPLLISNKKPFSSKYDGKPLLYGTFIKAGTYNGNEAKPPEYLSDGISDDDTSDEDDGDDDKSLLTNDTLQKMFKKTGLTGHKAARHGHSLNGKLQRLENQEAKQTSSNKKLTECVNIQNQNEGAKKQKKKKKIDKLSSISKLENVVPLFSDYDKLKESDLKVTEDKGDTIIPAGHISVNSDAEIRKKKKKKKVKVEQVLNSPVASCFSKLGTSVTGVTNKLTEKMKHKMDDDTESLLHEAPKKKKKKKKEAI